MGFLPILLPFLEAVTGKRINPGGPKRPFQKTDEFGGQRPKKKTDKCAPKPDFPGRPPCVYSGVLGRTASPCSCNDLPQIRKLTMTIMSRRVVYKWQAQAESCITVLQLPVPRLRCPHRLGYRQQSLVSLLLSALPQRQDPSLSPFHAPLIAPLPRIVIIAARPDGTSP